MRGESVSTYPRRPKAEALAQHGLCSRTSSRSDRSSTERTAPPSSAHVQPDDVPRTPIQPSFEGEFRQHDGVVMMMMFYRRRASPKHHNSIIEVDYGGGGTAHGYKIKSIVVSLGCPMPSYIKEQGGDAAGQEEARQEESYSHRE